MMMPPPPAPRSGLAWPLERAPADRRYRDGLGEQRPAKGPPVRHHAGIDLRAAFGEVVRAMAPGKVLVTFGWSGSGADAIIVGDEQGAILYGAVAPNSWAEFGLARGKSVKAGQPIARIGRYPDGDTMLHISAHAAGTRDPQRWYWGKLPPADLRDVRPYLEAAKATPEPWSLPTTDDVGRWFSEHFPTMPAWPPFPGTPAAPTAPPPAAPPAPAAPPVADGAGLLGLVVLAAIILGDDR